MKLISFTAMVLLGALTTDTLAQGRRFQLPPQAEKIVDGAYYLGRARDQDGREVDGIAFLHPRPGAAKPDGAGGGKPPKQETTCYTFLGSGARWRTVEPYIVDARNTHGLAESDVENIIVGSLEQWASAGGTLGSGQELPIFGDGFAGEVEAQDPAALNGVNEFSFGSVAEPNVIAVTIVWGIFRGPPAGRELVEWDMICDQADFNWAILGPTNEETPYAVNAMDLENIFLHEAGHAAGLGHPSGSCTEETMYASATNGETKKRTLNSGDIAGILALYE